MRIWSGATRTLIFLAIVGFSLSTATLLQHSAIGQRLEQRAYDVRFPLRGPWVSSAPSPIRILAIDQTSLGKISEPLILWQQHFARVIEALHKAGARVIGLDFIINDVGTFDSEGQRALSAALLRVGLESTPVILSYMVTAGGVTQPPPPVRLAASAAGHSLAYVNLTSDSDDFVRRQELFGLGEDAKVAGFALAVAREFSEEVRGRIDAMPASKRSILINYREPNHYSNVSFSTAIEALGRGDENFFEEHFRGRIVLVGQFGASRSEDLHATPHYHWKAEDGNAGSLRTSGIEIHANTISTLLEDSAIEPMPEMFQAGIALGIVGLITFLGLALSPGRAITASLLILGAFIFIALEPSFAAGHWVHIFSPILGSTLGLSLAQTGNYILEGRDKRKLRKLFERYVDERVIERVLGAADTLNLEGDRKHVVVLFADIVQFTSRSERTSPESLVADLNQYFALAVTAIRSRGGMVDKFIGDGVMALFGVPLEQENAAQRAVEASLDILEGVEDLNRKFEAAGSERIRVGIGIHQGDAVVGNIGSPDRMEYTAIGDTVNTADRIESLTRKLGANILISEELLRDLPEAFDIVSRGSENVKGRIQPVQVHEVLGRA